MNKYFEFSPSQLKFVLFLTGLMVIISVVIFIKGYSKVDEHSLKFSVSVGDPDRQYSTIFTVDLNRTPADSLELLPGIGPVLAGRIVAFRDSIKFEQITDIAKVPGIGIETYEKIKPYLKVSQW